jgi:hypothetical protein
MRIAASVSCSAQDRPGRERGSVHSVSGADLIASSYQVHQVGVGPPELQTTCEQRAAYWVRSVQPQAPVVDLWLAGGDDGVRRDRAGDLAWIASGRLRATGL